MGTFSKWKDYREGMVAKGGDKNPYPPGSAKAKRWLAGKEFAGLGYGHPNDFVTSSDARSESVDSEFSEIFLYKSPPKKKPAVRKNKTPKNDLEAAVQKECQKVLSSFGVLQWRNNVGAMKVDAVKAGAVKTGRRFIKFGTKGQPDLMGVMPDGIFIGCECKRREGGVTSDAQKKWGKSYHKWNSLWLVAHSGEELKNYLESKGYRECT